MSKIWLLLLFLAAFQFVHSYPAEFELDDDEYELDDDEFTNDEIDTYLSNDDEDEERGWGKNAKKGAGNIMKAGAGAFMKGAKKGLKVLAKAVKIGVRKVTKFKSSVKTFARRMSSTVKKAISKGAKALRKLETTYSINCEGPTCNVDISFLVFTCGLKLSFEDKFGVSFNCMGQNIIEKQFELNTPGKKKFCASGNKYCFELFECSVDSDKNFHAAVGFMVSAEGVGYKVIVSGVGKELSLDYEPIGFAGCVADDGEILQTDKNGQNLYPLDEDEYEID